MFIGGGEMRYFIITFLTTLVLFGGSMKSLPPKEKRFYISGPILKRPTTVYAKDRLEAVVSIGLTVWTEEEWNDAKKRCIENAVPKTKVEDNYVIGMTVKDCQDLYAEPKPY